MRTSRRKPLSGSKIKKLPQLKNITRRLKAQGKRIVFTNGCFDLLHYGHARYLEEAKAEGDILVVAVNSDASVRRIKGRDRPVVNERDRAGVIAALESVDFVVIFSEDTPLDTIKAIKPDILIKGADWSKRNIVGADFISEYGGRVSRIKLIKGRSTTKLINKIVKTF
jgi:rfaE bifunctional protein nucleotidyltransferase chain/domain